MKISPRSEKLKDDTAKDHFIATMSIDYKSHKLVAKEL